MAKKKAKRAPPGKRKSASPAPPPPQEEKAAPAQAAVDPEEVRPVPSDPPVAGICASAGGLNAYKKFFSAMPPTSGVAFVLVPHLDPSHESLMVELLARHTRMPVVEASDGLTVEGNRVYIVPPNKYMTIQEGVLRLTGPVERRGMQTTIDLFLRSLAEDRQERAICIILSGTGSHGALGLKAVKISGGMAMVQDPETADYDRMPRSAVATGLADYVLPVEEMPSALVKYVQHFYVDGGKREKRESPAEGPDQLSQVVAVLRARTRFDFRHYRKKMLVRRVERRMGLSHFDDLAAYLTHLREHPDEVKQLAKDLLISVTSFFRDPEAFHALETEVIAPLIQAREPEAPLRIWVPGCATGEEAYSIAMILLEQMAASQKNLRLQVFATDIDQEALETARQGIYSDSIAADVPPKRLERFFVRAGESAYQVNKPLRELVLFAAQNLITDAPFSKLDLISCRNLLIYLEPEAQKKLIALFHFALNEGGSLFLGPSETIGRQTDLFDPISKKWRIYRRIGPARPERVEFPISSKMEAAGLVRRPIEAGQARAPDFATLAQQALLQEFAPAAVLINHQYEILYYFGPTTRYLDQPTGEPTQDLMLMAREGLRTKLRAAIHKAVHQREPVDLSDLQVKREGSYHPVKVRVQPVESPRGTDGLLLIAFQDAAEPTVQPRASEATEDTLIRHLENELRATKEDLQGSIEELESTNEELKAANEEMMSMNEELQSTNEELETSKEELQSLNEELTTVNNQLQEKVAELEAANNDMANLLNCTDTATVFLDADFRIKRFTPTSTKVFTLIATDVGRPLGDIVWRFADPDLLADAAHVLHDLTPREKEVPLADGRWCIRRILPYRTVNNRVEGVVLTFSDVTQLKQAEAVLRKFNEELEQRVKERQERLHAIVANAVDAIITIDHRCIIESVNPAAERMFGYTAGEMIGQNVKMLMPPPYHEEHDTYVANYLKTGIKKIIGIGREVAGRRKDGTLFPVDLAVSEIRHLKLFTGVLRDITRRKELEKEVLEIAALKQRQIGEQLHDSVGQELTGLSLLADAVARRLKQQALPEGEEVVRVTAGLAGVHRQVRELSRGLVPVEVDPDGLRVALAELANRTSEHAGVTCTLDCLETVHVEEGTIATHLFYIAQEAVTNAIRHAQARRIAIGLRTLESGLALTVRDNGKGIDADFEQSSGLGIRLMRNRAGLIGGVLTISQAEGGGTLVTCTLPRNPKNG